MAPSFELPSLKTERYQSLTLGDLRDEETIIVAADALEMRGHLEVWETAAAHAPNRVRLIREVSREHLIMISPDDGAEIEVRLRSDEDIERYLLDRNVLIDITGLPHHAWASILRVAVKSGIGTRILYAEPEFYKPHPTPASSTLFDLSETFEGLAPLPGFARLDAPEDENKCLFIALLGFEGSRPERLVMQIDPTPKVIPVVGAPGFKIDYPALAIACNRGLLGDYSAYSDLRYVKASCPFATYRSLSEIHRDYPGYYMYLAPVGTKPHSLGAILYAIKNPENTEIMFDYPVRKAGRTRGIGVVHIYDFGDFSDI